MPVMCEHIDGSSAHQRGRDALKGLIGLLAATVDRARTDALQRGPYCLLSEGVVREYKRTGGEEQGRQSMGSSRRSRPGLGSNRPRRHPDDRRGGRDILGDHGTGADDRPIADV